MVSVGPSPSGAVSVVSVTASVAPVVSVTVSVVVVTASLAASVGVSAGASVAAGALSWAGSELDAGQAANTSVLISKAVITYHTLLRIKSFLLGIGLLRVKMNCERE